MGDVTRLLREFSAGERAALDELLPLVYDELRRIAQRHMRAERAGHTLEATALVHETFLKLVGQRDTNWQNRAQFFAIAAQAMRRILVSGARRRMTQKRGGGEPMVALGEADHAQPATAQEILEIDDALGRLAERHVRQAQVAELFVFAGLKHHEIAEILGVSVPTVRRDWRLGRAFLSVALGDSPGTQVAPGA